MRPEPRPAPPLGATTAAALASLRAIPPRAPRRTSRGIELGAVHPNAGLAIRYARRLDSLVAEMHADIEHALATSWAAERIAMDASPAIVLRAVLARLARTWQGRFDKAAPELARYFATAMRDRSDANLRAILKRAGMSVEFRMTRAMSDAYQAVIGEQVGLIKSIASQHLADVQGAVFRSVSAGRDIGALTSELHARYDITRKRAALIARTTNAQATSTFVKARQIDLGLKAKWRHSAGGREPRPTHKANDGNLFDPSLGWLDPDVGHRIWPGELINCRCVSVSVVPGFT